MLVPRPRRHAEDVVGRPVEALAADDRIAAAEKLKLHACSDFRCIGFIGNDNRIRISISISYYKEGLLQGRVEMALPKVVVTNWVHPEVVATLEPHCRVSANPGREPWPEDTLQRDAADADALMTFMPDSIDEAFLAACPRLRMRSEEHTSELQSL